LQRLEIDLPESAIFHNKDIAHIARVCPNLEVLRLCGLAKFTPAIGSPFLTLEGIVPLTMECRRLHTLSVVVNALEGRPETFKTREVCSRSLQRLSVGYSWIKDPLQTAILLSHLAPYLDSVRWLTPTTRAGTVEASPAAWQKVSDLLPHLQAVRLMERNLLSREHLVATRETKEVMVDATPMTVSRGVTAAPKYVDEEVEVFPDVVDVQIEALPHTSEMSIDATPEMVEEEVSVMPSLVDEGVSAVPETVEEAIEVMPPPVEEEEEVKPNITYYIPAAISSYIPTVNGIVTLPIRAVKVYTYYLTFPLRYMLSFTPNMPMPNILSHSEKASANGDHDASASEKIMQTMELMPPSYHDYQNSETSTEPEPEPEVVSPVCQ
ncbi:hypothetical protein EUX98_g9059, partial [Antrodiella citrinella]